MTTTQDPKAGQQRTSPRVTVGAALASVVPDGLPFRPMDIYEKIKEVYPNGR